MSPDLTDKLIRLGWSEAIKRTGKKVIAAAPRMGNRKGDISENSNLIAACCNGSWITCDNSSRERVKYSKQTV